MSTQRKRGLAVEGISEEAVTRYLQTHPDFFEHNAALLASLRLPHDAGPAVSLVERQVTILRQRNRKLDRKLQELISVGRLNDAIAAKIHRLAKALIAARDLSRVLIAVESSLRDDFGAEFSLMALFGGGPTPEVPAAHFLRRMDREDSDLAPLASFLKAATPRCGRATDAQKRVLFGNDGEVIASTALIPLGEGAGIGFLAVGSRDPERFQPTMSTDFLVRIGDLVGHTIAEHGA